MFKSCSGNGFTSSGVLGTSRYNDQYRCVVRSASRSSAGLTVGFVVFGDGSLGPLQEPDESKLEWDGGEATPSSKKYVLYDPEFCISGSLTYSDVPTDVPVSFTFGKGGYSKVEISHGCDAEVTQSSVDAAPIPEGGNKKALLVGINYLGKGCELGGCINDVRGQMEVLKSNFGFEEENIKLLTEDQDSDDVKPTKATIMAGLEWLLDGAAAGDLLFFHYSGHGTQYPDQTGEEPDGQNEAICPLDCQDAPWPDNLVLDNELHTALCEKLPENCKCVCIYDCCHSGSVGDLEVQKDFCLPGMEDLQTKTRFLKPPDDIAEQIAGFSHAPGTAKKGVAAKGAEKKHLWIFSGCQDNQTSADAFINGKRQGALTWGLTKALGDADYDITYESLLIATRANLKGQYSQVPALSTTDESYLPAKYMA